MKHYSSSGANLESRGTSGYNALHYASIGGHRETIEHLLEFCNVEETDFSGRNALDHAIDNLNKYVYLIFFAKLNTR